MTAKSSLVAVVKRAEDWVRDYDDVTVEREAGQMILGLHDSLMVTLVAFYNADYRECARVCDEVLDPSGGLLGQVREEARREHG